MCEIITLKNGARLVLERLPFVRSAAIGIWVEAGTRHEPHELSGISHFIEHMVFKGTPTRSARAIAEEMDCIGGEINAFTAMECTCFYARALDTHIDIAADVLCDLFFNAKFDDDDIALERGVVLEEISMYEDSPEDLVTDRLSAAIYRGSSLGAPILGTKTSLNRLNHDVLHDYRAKSYTSKATVVSVSGSFDDSLVEYLKARFGEMPTCEKLTYTPAVYNRAITCKSKDIEQNHICICFPGFSYNDEARYTLRMLNSILGGGMSSRLFQSVRENAGLCYSIASFANAYADAGELNFYVALGRDTERAALELMKSEIIKMAEHGVTQSELDRVREHYKAGLVMAMESTSKRMTLGAQSVMRTGRVPDIEELLRDTDAVTTENVKELACSMFMFENASFSGVGKLRDRREYIKFLG